MKLRQPRGQALTEMVLMLPLMILLFLIAQQYFYMMERSQMAHMAVHYASRAHAMTHSTGLSEAHITERIKTDIFGVKSGDGSVKVEFGSPKAFGNVATAAMSSLVVVLQVAGFPSSPSYRKVTVTAEVKDLFPGVNPKLKPFKRGQKIEVEAEMSYLRPGI